ncbi:MAG: methionine--tRNA ligase [Rickettsiales bacterium]|nr:methionine--tRNA ligase [Rickettsiales bacterium]
MSQQNFSICEEQNFSICEEQNFSICEEQNFSICEEQNFYITSPIYYVNDIPHIGHAYTSLACDVQARFRRLQGMNVRFLTGTDEHGQKVEKSALARGLQPQEFCDQVSLKFRELVQTLGLSHDDFIRTTEERHKICAQEFWRRLEKRGFIYKDVYEGWYCVRDEAFYGEDELVDGKAPTGAEVTWHKEESYFFKLSAFQDKLLMLYEAAPDFVQPQSKMNEVLSFVRGGLRDLSISRTSFKWGIKVPTADGSSDNGSHIMYVWLDALTNYLSALGFPDEKNPLYQNFWCNTELSPVHIVGKDILRFHAIYWPAFLMAADLPLPHSIFAHGWWTNQGQKISKSVGNVIDPLQEIEWIETLGCSNQTAIDYFKYFLLREVPFGNDGDYSRDNLITRVNAELANNIGNLVQRSLSMIYKNNNGEIVDISGFVEGQELLKNGYDLQEKLVQKMDKFAYDQAIGEIINFASMCNAFINDKAPWSLKKEGKILEMNLVLSTIAESLRIIMIALQPFLPCLTKQVIDFLQIDQNLCMMKHIDKKYVLAVGHKISEPKIIFPRMNAVAHIV